MSRLRAPTSPTKLCVRPGRTAGVAALAAAVAACALTALPARAAIFGDDEARRAILELRGRVDAQATQAQDLQRRLADVTARLERIENSYATTRTQLELTAQIEQLRQEVARLRGQLEVQTNDLASVQRRQRDIAESVDNRLRSFEPVQVVLDGQTVAVDPNERRLYEQALGQFRAGDFNGALAGFQALQTRNPASPYVPSAQFWIGSAQFALREWKAAATTLQALLTRYPDSPRVPDALLTLASAQLELNDRRAARATLQTLIDKYPTSPAAETARQRIASIPAQTR